MADTFAGVSLFEADAPLESVEEGEKEAPQEEPQVQEPVPEEDIKFKTKEGKDVQFSRTSRSGKGDSRPAPASRKLRSTRLRAVKKPKQKPEPDQPNNE